MMRRDIRDTSAGHRTGAQMGTKLKSLTLRAHRDSKCKFTSLAHLLTVEFLKDCFQELKREKASGVDGVSVKMYKIYHLTYNLSSCKGCVIEEPCVGKPQARFCEGY